jgi:hypothetical protein
MPDSGPEEHVRLQAAWLPPVIRFLEDHGKLAAMRPCELRECTIQLFADA